MDASKSGSKKSQRPAPERAPTPEPDAADAATVVQAIPPELLEFARGPSARRAVSVAAPAHLPAGELESGPTARAIAQVRGLPRMLMDHPPLLWRSEERRVG